jgi:folate-binding Fe-S cluster repair protein YgfZ
MGGEIISRALNTLVQRQRLVLFHLNAPISQIPRWLHLYRQEKTCKFPVVVLGVQTIGIILNCRRLARDLGSDMFTDSSFSVTTPQVVLLHLKFASHHWFFISSLIWSSSIK